MNTKNLKNIKGMRYKIWNKYKIYKICKSNKFENSKNKIIFKNYKKCKNHDTDVHCALQFAVCTWITPPPGPLELNRKCSGKLSSLASQSIITVSSSVHAGLAVYENIFIWKKGDSRCNVKVRTTLVVECGKALHLIRTLKTYSCAEFSWDFDSK